MTIFKYLFFFAEVEVVESGRKALEILDTPGNGVQLVLCDLHMPDGKEKKGFLQFDLPPHIVFFSHSVDGIGLVESVRSKEHIKGLPIVST